MPEPSDRLAERLRDATPALSALLAEVAADRAERTDADRGTSVEGDHPARAGDVRPRWSAFEDAFPTFYQFTNRPR